MVAPKIEAPIELTRLMRSVDSKPSCSETCTTIHRHPSRIGRRAEAAAVTPCDSGSRLPPARPFTHLVNLVAGEALVRPGAGGGGDGLRAAEGVGELGALLGGARVHPHLRAHGVSAGRPWSTALLPAGSRRQPS